MITPVAITSCIIGEIYSILIEYLTKDLENQNINWREFYLYAIYPLIAASLLIYFFFPESISYFIKKN